MLPVFELLGLKLYTYPLLLGIIWAISYHLSLFLLEYRKVSFKYFKLFYFGLFISSWIGAKVFYLLTLEFEMVKLASMSTNFWLGGGFVFYGGLIFGLMFTAVFSLLSKQQMKTFTFAIPVLCLGHSLGRIGCLLAGCCYGSVTKFPLSLHIHGADRHPVQLYESIGLLILFIVTFELFKKGKSVIKFYLAAYGLLRFSLEFFRGDKIRGEDVLYIFSTSQLIAISIIILVIINFKFGRSA
jgi:phosphatidylglycerol:prolipoprotein diacylglycerol transferase